MTLASALAPSINAKVRARGAHYFRGGRVRLTSCGPEKAEAVVTGTSRYDVVLTREAKVLRSTCTCPFTDRGEPCKHIWAAILAADAKGGRRGFDSALPFRLTVAGAADGGLTEFPTGEDVLSEPASPRLTPPQHPRPRAATRRPSWHEVIDHLGNLQPTTPPAAVAPGKEILYVLDMPSTLESQQLTLEVMTSRRKRDGSWGKLYLLFLSRDAILGLPDADDRKILSLLAGTTYGGHGRQWYGNAYSEMVPTHCEIPREAAGILFPLLGVTDRLRLRRDFDSEVTEPLSWNGEVPWELWLEVREHQDGYVVSASLRRGEERLPPGKTAWLLRCGFVLTPGQISRLADDGAFRWAPLLSKENALQVPAADRDELLERLLASPDLPKLELPDNMRVEEARPVPRPRLRLLRPDTRPPYWPLAALSFVYDGHEVPAGLAGRGLFQREGRRFLLRDLEAERRHASRLRDLGFRTERSSSGKQPWLRIPPTRIPKAVRILLAAGWSIEAEGKLYRSAGAFKMKVATGIDWFELHGEVDFEGQTVRLPQLLAALRRGERFIPLGDGTLGVLPEEWIKKFAPVAGLGQPEGDHLRFRPAQAVLLDAWLAEEPEVTFDQTFESARQRLRGFAAIAPADAPAGFRGELRGYQRSGLGWLHFLRDFGFGGCLADDMGLGKTIQVLALLESRRAGRRKEARLPSLVVVPRSLVFNWLAEAARFTPALRVIDHTGTSRARDAESLAQGDLVLTTYGTLRRDVAALTRREFDYVILDEAQAIKNADSQTAKAARLLRGRHRLALTGTPVENHLGELWSLLEFLNPGILGASPLLAANSEELRDPDPETRQLLARALRPFILRRTKEQVAPELPAKLEQTLFCELPPKQRRLYDELRDHYRSALGARIGEQGLGRAKILVLEALLRLRQAACHPGLLDRDRASEPCAKLDLLLPQLQEILDEGHKALVFSQFTSFLALLREQLDRGGVSYLYLDGRTRDRKEKVERFQSDPDCRLFLISLKAGGLGLNLTAADYVYLLDPWWNPAVESQAIDRAHRIGQQRPVFASRIVAKDTVEEKILELQKSKRELADAVIQADSSVLAGLSREDLDLLLS